LFEGSYTAQKGVNYTAVWHYKACYSSHLYAAFTKLTIHYKSILSFYTKKPLLPAHQVIGASIIFVG